VAWYKQRGYHLNWDERLDFKWKGFQHLDPIEEESRCILSIVSYLLMLDHLASYAHSLPNCAFTTAQRFIQEVLVPTLQHYHTQNRYVTRFDELRDPENIAKMEIYSGTSTKNTQPVVISPGATDFFSFIDNAGFKAPRGKAIMIIVMWTWDGTDYAQLNAEHEALEEENKRMEKLRIEAEKEKREEEEWARRREDIFDYSGVTAEDVAALNAISDYNPPGSDRGGEPVVLVRIRPLLFLHYPLCFFSLFHA
jgi:hypothetical protein